jgi:hypothetical protein
MPRPTPRAIYVEIGAVEDDPEGHRQAGGALAVYAAGGLEQLVDDGPDDVRFESEDEAD